METTLGKQARAGAVSYYDLASDLVGAMTSPSEDLADDARYMVGSLVSFLGTGLLSGCDFLPYWSEA